VEWASAPEQFPLTNPGEPMSVAYQKAYEKYRTLAKAASGGDKQAFADKAKAMQDIRNIERDSARNGKVLNAVYKGDQVVVETTDAPTKRSLQEEYIRKFDKEKRVLIDGKEQSLQEYHSKRLLGR
jgi:hypothetical protein